MSTALTVQRFMPALSIAEADERYQQFRQFVGTQLAKDRDYGVIPGTNKPTLLKPGAEKLCTFFGLTVPDPEIVEKVEDWTGKEHGGEPLFFYNVRQQIMRGGEVVASQFGSCNSWEKKYRWRSSDRVCPLCGKATIRKSKAERGGGWYCWAKIEGCGANFKAGDQSIEAQQVGRVPNPDIYDSVNTVLKMAEKRAFLSAALIATNASEFFTVDLEDFQQPAEGEVVDAPKAEPKSEALNGQDLIAAKKTSEEMLANVLPAINLAYTYDMLHAAEMKPEAKRLLMPADIERLDYAMNLATARSGRFKAAVRQIGEVVDAAGAAALREKLKGNDVIPVVAKDKLHELLCEREREFEPQPEPVAAGDEIPY